MLDLGQILIFRTVNAAGPMFLQKTRRISYVTVCGLWALKVHRWFAESNTVRTLDGIHLVSVDPSAAVITTTTLPWKHSWTNQFFNPLIPEESSVYWSRPSSLTSECPKALTGSLTTAEHVWMLCISPLDLHHGSNSLILWKDWHYEKKKNKGLVLPLNETNMDQIGYDAKLTPLLCWDQRERGDPLWKGDWIIINMYYE